VARNPEGKYKAKQVIDTFVMRAGDSLSAALTWIGARTAMSARGFIAITVVFTLAWLGLALLLARTDERPAQRCVEASAVVHRAREGLTSDAPRNDAPSEPRERQGRETSGLIRVQTAPSAESAACSASTP
jgi:hypothetical protein